MSVHSETRARYDELRLLFERHNVLLRFDKRLSELTRNAFKRFTELAFCCGYLRSPQNLTDEISRPLDDFDAQLQFAGFVANYDMWIVEGEKFRKKLRFSARLYFDDPAWCQFLLANRVPADSEMSIAFREEVDYLVYNLYTFDRAFSEIDENLRIRFAETVAETILDCGHLLFWNSDVADRSIGSSLVIYRRFVRIVAATDMRAFENWIADVTRTLKPLFLALNVRSME